MIRNGKFKAGDSVDTAYGSGRVVSCRGDAGSPLGADNNEYEVEVPGACGNKVRLALGSGELGRRGTSRQYTDLELANGANGIYG